MTFELYSTDNAVNDATTLPTARGKRSSPITCDDIDEILLLRSEKGLDPPSIARVMKRGHGSIYEILRATHHAMTSQQRRFAATLPPIAAKTMRRKRRTKLQIREDRERQAAKAKVARDLVQHLSPKTPHPPAAGRSDVPLKVLAAMTKSVKLLQMQVVALNNRLTTFENMMLWMAKDDARTANEDDGHGS